jgi:hypothetical protein
MFYISGNTVMLYFTFFGTIVGYNFVKYETLVKVHKNQMSPKLKAIVLLSIISLFGVGICFFLLQRITQMVSIVVLILTLLYTLPFFPNRKNARNWAGVKIYIVALCWVGVTLALPILNAEIPVTYDFYIKCIQRFILVFVLILIFEIIDLKNDDPFLQTVPQQIGVWRTKILGYLLLFIFCGLEFVKINFQYSPLTFEIVIAIFITFFLAFANEKRSKYFTSFWAEGIPILWWLMVWYFM